MASDIPEPPRRRPNLPAWLEWVTAISALVISICSIGIAVYNARIESRLLKANSYPYLVSGVSDATPDGPERISIDLLNNGVGPADERSLRIKVGSRYVTDVKDFVRTAMGPAAAAQAGDLLTDLHDNEPTRFIAAKDRVMVFRIDKTPQNARYWQMLDDGMNRQGVRLDYCYCSVFEECWAVQGDVRKPVKACIRDRQHEFTPKARRPASPLPPR
jgi:hypothetical protein